MTISLTDVDAGRRAPTSPLICSLPSGWHHLPIPNVHRTVVVGPGGLFVLVTRSASVAPLDRPSDRPWNGVEHRGATSAQVTADLVSQLLSSLCDLDLVCRPAVVLNDDDQRLVACVDDVPVFHRRRLAEWLGRQPARLDPFTTADIVQTVTGARPLHSV